jgi:erythromycin esterase-like protein
MPLPPLSEAAFARHFRDFADCKVLLIGDASHGTSEFYRARAEITKYMIQYHGFNIVAVEADWQDAEADDRYVRRQPARQESCGARLRRWAEMDRAGACLSSVPDLDVAQLGGTRLRRVGTPT